MAAPRAVLPFDSFVFMQILCLLAAIYGQRSCFRFRVPAAHGLLPANTTSRKIKGQPTRPKQSEIDVAGSRDPLVRQE